MWLAMMLMMVQSMLCHLLARMFGSGWTAGLEALEERHSQQSNNVAIAQV